MADLVNHETQAPEWSGGSVPLLVVCKPDLTGEDFDRLEGLVDDLATEMRWSKRGGRLVLLLHGVPPDDGRLAEDAAVEYVLRNPSREETSRTFSRRELLDVALASTGLLAAATIAAPLGLFLSAPVRHRSSYGEVFVGRVESFPVGGAQTKLIDHEDHIIVRRDEKHFYALAATCTHSEICLVNWDARRQQLVCPCHRGIFDLYGNVVAGPPPRPLTRHEVIVRDGGVYVQKEPA